jgi:hypothetical protein
MGDDMFLLVEDNDDARDLAVLVFKQAKLTGCCGLGANSYLRKPANFLDFTELAQRIAGGRVKCNRVPPVHAA